MNAVKSAIANISSRLRESQHRDRSHFHGRLQSSPERFFPTDDDYGHLNNASRRMPVDGNSFSSRMSTGLAGSRSNSFASRASGYALESGAAPIADNSQQFLGEDIVFRILCPVDKVEFVVGESDGILELLRNEIGVDVKVADLVAGSNEQIIVITSEEVCPSSFFCVLM